MARKRAQLPRKRAASIAISATFPSWISPRFGLGIGAATAAPPSRVGDDAALRANWMPGAVSPALSSVARIALFAQVKKRCAARAAMSQDAEALEHFEQLVAALQRSARRILAFDLGECRGDHLLLDAL